MEILRRGPLAHRMTKEEAEAHYRAKAAHLETETMRASNHFIADVLKGSSLDDAYTRVAQSYGLDVRDNLEGAIHRVFNK